MIPLPEDITPNDVHQWLHGGYFLVEVDGLRLPASLIDVESDTIHARRVDSLEAVAADLASVYAYWPRCGAINLPQRQFSLYVQRQQRRQYRRTFNWRCCELHILGKWEMLKAARGGALQVREQDPDLLQALFSPEYPQDFLDAQSMLVSGWSSVALSPVVTLVQRTDDSISVYYRDAFAGTVRGNTFEGQCPPKVQQAIQYLLRR